MGRIVVLMRRTCAVLLCALSVALAACGSGGANQPILKASGLVGTWSGSLGTITFRADRTFETRHLNIPDLGSECTNLSMSGTWKFISQSSASGASPSTHKPGSAVEAPTNHKRGSLVEADFYNPRDVCSFAVTTWQIDGPLGLCYYADPDSPCADGEPFEPSQ